MELKVQCNCGQNYKFDVEPVNGQMPFTVNCPTCGVDGTSSANSMIAQTAPVTAPPPGGLRINRTEPAPATVSAAPPAFAPPPLANPKPPVRPKQAAEFNTGLGLLGAFLGAALGSGLMIGFSILVGFRFPLLGVGIGALTGYGAKLLYKGTSNTLGLVAGCFALLAVTGTLFFIYGTFPIISIISVVVSVSVSYRIATGS